MLIIIFTFKSGKEYFNNFYTSYNQVSNTKVSYNTVYVYDNLSITQQKEIYDFYKAKGLVVKFIKSPDLNLEDIKTYPYFICDGGINPNYFAYLRLRMDYGLKTVITSNCLNRLSSDEERQYAYSKYFLYAWQNEISTPAGVSVKITNYYPINFQFGTITLLDTLYVPKGFCYSSKAMDFIMKADTLYIQSEIACSYKSSLILPLDPDNFKEATGKDIYKYIQEFLLS
jgi:hypothetical protein